MRASLRLREPAHHELLLLDALDLEPALPAAGFVRPVAALGYHTFEREPARLAEELAPLADDVGAVADGAVSPAARRASPARASGPRASRPSDPAHPGGGDRRRSTRAVRGRWSTRAFWRAWKLVVPLGRSTAISPSRSACRTGRRATAAAMAGKLVGPVPCVAAPESRPSFLDPAEDPVAVELHLVEPLVARRRCRNEGGQLWLHEVRQPAGAGARNGVTGRLRASGGSVAPGRLGATTRLRRLGEVSLGLIGSQWRPRARRALLPSAGSAHGEKRQRVTLTTLWRDPPASAGSSR